ncbi:longitudinals lacking protein, isoforms H/M/V isoform X8 [Lucilia cuprina]|uniref:longitudinals lacking protein, isoforms H/M/V isoform X8 n=1 Tax=Lucilia cuprina TaxID=7375 RepID=UPI001F059FA6|nr:longitudinals lacking protein, isoforms H/M/V isoform X8 [Lucilia cuprina]
MDDDQQFCLRWNNHQSTLISVFDTLLENETLVDCTLAAEGKFLKAHKVVLSACSPYFATLLQEQYDKHPIFILKDVKYQELRAMMDYMYRGEVNISQDQLAALLKAAESLQIKGLSDNRSGGGTTAPKPEHHRATMPTGKLSAGYTLEQTKRARIAGPAEPEMGSREGSSSPSRRRRKVRRRSIENAMTDVHDNSNSSQQQTQSNASGLGAITAAASALAAAAAAAPNTQSLASNVPLSASTSSSTAVTAPGTTLSSSKKTDIVKGTTQQQQQTQQDAMNTDNVQGPASAATATGSIDTETTDSAAAVASTATDKSNHKQLQQQLKQAKESISGNAAAGSGSELVIEPKAEYDDEANDEPVEDLTLDEEDMGMDDLDQNAGTSQGGEGSSQGYAPWQHDRSQDELLLATQEAQQRDPQDISYKFSQSMIEGGNYLKINEHYKFNNSLMEGGGGVAANGSTERFPCAVCGKSYLRKRHLQRHMRDECIGIPPRFSCDLCPSRFRRKYHMVRHLTSKHGIPPAIAQQTTGNSNRNNTLAHKDDGEGGVLGGVATLNHVNLVNCDNGLPENLTMRKENYEHEPTQMHQQQQHHHHIHHQLNMGSASPSHMTSGDSGSDCNGGGTAGTSPIPPSHIMPMPTYGLTGAITAISAAAAHVEEKDAKILLEAAAAAAQAAAHNNNLQQNSSNITTPPPPPSQSHEDTENVAENQSTMTTTTATNTAGANTTNEASFIKAEPLTPNKTMSPTGGALNMLDDEWKMKLSLQLISNSLLKERLMNTMPFAYKNN